MAGVGGLAVGALVGVAQWLALRPRGIGTWWIAATALAAAAGTGLGAVVTDAGTGLGDVMVSGLITGALIGVSQATLLAPGAGALAIWTAATAAGWSLGWLASWSIIDAERGYYVFGASGALVATVLTGLTLRVVLAPRRASGVAFLQSDAVPDWLGVAGLVSGPVLMLCALEFVGAHEPRGWKLAEKVTPIAYVAWSAWLLATGVALLA